MSELTPGRRAYEVILAAIKDHRHDGNGLCACGCAIGWSDGFVIEVHEAEHQAAVASRTLADEDLLSWEAAS